MEKFEQSIETEFSKSTKHEQIFYKPVETSNFVIEDEINDRKEADNLLRELEGVPQKIHYSKLSSEQLREVEISKKQTVGFLEDQLTLICSRRTDVAHKEYAIEKTLSLFTPDATVNYFGKVRGQRRTLMELPINDFLHAIANGDIDVDGVINSDDGLLGKSIRTWSPLLETEVSDLPYGEKITYKSKISGMDIYERPLEGMTLNRDDWSSDQIMTK